MKYRDFERILMDWGFVEVRQSGRHRQLEAVIDGKRRLVTVAYSRGGEDIRDRNLASMVRQSGLPKKLFR